ncbi:M81 family metallopeptidase [Conexibacter sp. CPCC 206217]|uniref:M81 family metallopeptidase n=1 Tax=Conexibacter sp. CPCC 206217 TaxID=3064574 RepID=UPI00271E2F3C|nr:M81 family metallopeptidase [Conexibacter sp. CPCC 206217]MDO8210339.1 M81 family metallopeptidase [Conexibacter sp. CPCC 206217]
MSRRVAVLSMWHETNTYAVGHTRLADFEAFELLEGEAVFAHNRDTGSVLGGFLDETELELVPCFAAGAWPGPIVAQEALDHILERALATVEQAGELDGILLNLHGAMVAEEDEDPERTLVEALAHARPGVPLVVVLDLHANPSRAFVERCDVVIAYDTYPHVDMRERGREAAALMRELLGGRRLKTLVAKVPILASLLKQGTAQEPMRGLQQRLRGHANRAGIARVSIAAGFAFSDVERAGVSALVVHEPGRRHIATAILEETERDIRAHRQDFHTTRPAPAQAVARAIAAPLRPVVLADVGDNVGGGCPGDGTALLHELLRQGASGAVVIIADAVAALAAAQLGEGAAFSGMVGGRTDAMHGAPVQIDGTVVRVTDGRYRTAGTWMSGQTFSMGTTAVVDCGGTEVVLTQERVPPFHREQLTSVGIDPAQREIIVAKGAIAWRAAFGTLARTVIEVDTPGICPVEPDVLPRRTVPVGS